MDRSPTPGAAVVLKRHRNIALFAGLPGNTFHVVEPLWAYDDFTALMELRTWYLDHIDVGWIREEADSKELRIEYFRTRG